MDRKRLTPARIVRALYWRSRPYRERLGLGLVAVLRGADFRPVYIDPADVEWTVSRDDPTLKHSAKWHFGTVRGGDWDLDGYPVTEYGLIYPILKQRIEDGTPLEDIPEFRLNIRYIESGGSPDNCNTVADYTEKWHRIEELCRTIERDGFKTQIQLGSPHRYNEVRLQVGRHGRLLLEEGVHRTMIAKVLGLSRMPAILTRTHAAYDGPRPGDDRAAT